MRSEVMWLGISKGVLGYDEINTDGEVTVRSEFARLTRLYSMIEQLWSPLLRALRQPLLRLSHRLLQYLTLMRVLRQKQS